jgi:hypothetical protein
MRCKEADVLLLCKRNFDGDKFPNYYEAIRDYQATWANCPIEAIREPSVLCTMILPACEKYFKPHNWAMVVARIYDKDQPFACSWFPKENTISHILTNQLSNIQVRRSDGSYIIEDLRDYMD